MEIKKGMPIYIAFFFQIQAHTTTECKSFFMLLSLRYNMQCLYLLNDSFLGSI